MAFAPLQYRIAKFVTTQVCANRVPPTMLSWITEAAAFAMLLYRTAKPAYQIHFVNNVQ